MPEREKPHMMRVRVVNPDGTSEMKTVRADELVRATEHRTPVLTDVQIQRAEALWEAVGKVARPDIDVAKWVDTFKFEASPDAELDAWEHIARVFDKVGGRKLGATQRAKTLRAILGISTGTVDVESQTGLTATAVKRLRDAYNAED